MTVSKRNIAAAGVWTHRISQVVHRRKEDRTSQDFSYQECKRSESSNDGKRQEGKRKEKSKEKQMFLSCIGSAERFYAVNTSESRGKK